MLYFSFLLFFCATMASAQHPLLIPDTLSGADIALTLRGGSVAFLPGAVTATMGVNGEVLGPTLLLERGRDVRIEVRNELPDPTTVHWHGMHVAPQNDGGPHVVVASGGTWNPRFTVLDHAATYWYHPHLHEKTNLHVSKGIAGFIIVRDAEEAALALPRRYGVDDIPLAVQTKHFDAGNQIVIETHTDATVLVNATIDPVLDVPAQVVRLRLLNGATERVFRFGFSDNRTFQQIATDGGLLAAPVPLTRLQLAPGERAEILVDFGGQEGSAAELRSYASEMSSGIYGAAQPGMMPGQTLTGYAANPLNGRDFHILALRVTSPTSDAVTTIPHTLLAPEVLREEEADTTRGFVFTSRGMGMGMLGGPFVINGAAFDMGTINERIPFGNTEIWELRNQTPIAHPFHIHDVQFRILDINGAPPPPQLAGRKDVVLVPPGNGTVRFITRFETFSDDIFPYMYHCHMLTHEDEGMMGQFLVLPPVTSSADAAASVSGLSIGQNYPNPVSSSALIPFATARAGDLRLELVDMLGRVVRTLRSGTVEAGNHHARFDAAGLPDGVYTAVLTDAAGRRVLRPMLLLGN